MNFQKHDIKTLAEYRQKAADAGDVRQRVAELAERSKTDPDQLRHAGDLWKELQIRTKELEDLRQVLGPAGTLVAKYGVQVIDQDTVSFVLPQGVSRLAIIDEAKTVRPSQRLLVYPSTLNAWRADPRFTTCVERSESVVIRAWVEDADDKARPEQLQILKEKGLEVATYEDLAVAFVLNWAATGEPLFPWYNPDISLTREVRAEGGVLRYDNAGLYNFHERQNEGSSISVRLPLDDTTHRGD